MKIPKRFNLIGMEWKVETQPNLLQRNGVFGLCELATHTILLQEANKDFSKDAQRLTFLHELQHAYFFVLNENELNSNEKLVDMLGNLRLQFEKSASYK
jgi:hypothetical protein